LSEWVKAARRVELAGGYDELEIFLGASRGRVVGFRVDTEPGRGRRPRLEEADE